MKRYVLLSEIKGAPLSCMMAMKMIGGPLDAEWLENITGYSKTAIRKGLETLERLGLVYRDDFANGRGLVEGAWDRIVGDMNVSGYVKMEASRGKNNRLN